MPHPELRGYARARLYEEEHMASLHDFTMESITGESVDLSSYEGKVCLVVNVASQ